MQADNGALEDIDAKDGAARGVDTSRHFSYYAFEGKTGVLRWKHEVSGARHVCARPVGSATQGCHDWFVAVCTALLETVPRSDAMKGGGLGSQG